VWSPRYFAKRYFPARYFGPSAQQGAGVVGVGDTTQASQISGGRASSRFTRGGLAGYVYKLPLVYDEPILVVVGAAGRSKNPPQRVAATATLGFPAAGKSTQGSAVTAAAASVRSPLDTPREQASQTSGGKAVNRENEDWLLLVA
jgi:hypothetical protein